MKTKHRGIRYGVFAAVVLSLTACQQRMAHQPGYRPLDETEFFADRRSARPLEEGTVHRAQLLDHDPMVSGLSAKGKLKQEVKIAGVDNPVTMPGIPNDVKNFVDVFPFKMSKEDLVRGQERYQIYCVPCHSPLGDGRGKIWERGYLAPPSYHLTTDEETLKKDPKHGRSRGFGFYNVTGPDNKPIALRDVPVGYIYEVITKGYGGMPDHASQIQVADRWRIVAYVKALMVSQNAGKEGALKLNDQQWADVEKELGAKK